MDRHKDLRQWIQATTTLLTNIIFPNFAKGTIYQGKIKQVCVPGLNCYSCPGAIGSCPIGAFQSVVGSSKFSFSYYVIGMVILIGAILGRVVCGFLCPFGWFQELLHKIPSKKYSTKKLKILTKLKYIILLLFVGILPVVVVNKVGIGDPFFCKYICPAGILEGGIPLAIVDVGIRNSLGWLFTWKSVLLLGVIVMSIFFYRPFCKWICPLGAFYSFFNRIALYRYVLDETKCISCDACNRVCKMDVEITKNINDVECIRCGDCMRICPKLAIQTSLNARKNKINKGIK